MTPRHLVDEVPDADFRELRLAVSLDGEPAAGLVLAEVLRRDPSVDLADVRHDHLVLVRRELPAEQGERHLLEALARPTSGLDDAVAVVRDRLDRRARDVATGLRVATRRAAGHTSGPDHVGVEDVDPTTVAAVADALPRRVVTVVRVGAPSALPVSPVDTVTAPVVVAETAPVPPRSADDPVRVAGDGTGVLHLVASAPLDRRGEVALAAHVLGGHAASWLVEEFRLRRGWSYSPSAWSGIHADGL